MDDPTKGAPEIPFELPEDAHKRPDNGKPYAKGLRTRLAAGREERSFRGQSSGNPNARTLSRIQFGEGFKLMKYVSTEDGFVEWIWNSRDGVSPFGVSDMREGVDAFMQHADWGEDTMVPNFIPPVGSRVFMDHDQERAKAGLADRKALFERQGRAIPEAAEKAIIEEFLKSPRVAVVDDELHQHFRKLATETPWCPPRRAA